MPASSPARIAASSCFHASSADAAPTLGEALGLADAELTQHEAVPFGSDSDRPQPTVRAAMTMQQRIIPAA